MISGMSSDHAASVGTAGPALDPRAGSEPHARPPLRRRPDEGLLGGVCAGIAARLDANVRVVRIVTAAVAGVGGVGVMIYALAWALVPVATESEGRQRRPGAWREAVMMVLSVVAVLWGLLWGLRYLGLGLGPGIIWPAVIGACGVALVWRPTVGPSPAAPSSAGARRSLRGLVSKAARLDGPRVFIGVLMVAFAVAALLRTFSVLQSLGRAIGAVAIVAGVFGALIIPWFVRLARSLGSERAARIREQERAEVAAHLHDSVLQTLALIQKRSGDPHEVATLARRQERELREWLHEGRAAPEADTVASALRQAAAEVEELHGMPIEVVTVGDKPLDGSLEALVLAAREAMTNAAKFSGSGQVDLYAEVRNGRVDVFVRDRGVGFDTQAVPPDRRGLRDSIQGRMERHRGLARVHSRPGEGTEVELQVGAT
jgi:signal transduction histidine kinase/phage shock protein PspC (stress-responsive transcriptional regulator)